MAADNNGPAMPKENVDVKSADPIVGHFAKMFLLAAFDSFVSDWMVSAASNVGPLQLWATPCTQPSAAQ